MTNDTTAFLEHMERDMRRLIVFSLLTTTLLAVGCGKTQTDTAQTPDQKVALAAATAKEIQADPDRGDTILKRYNLTQERFEDLLYEIAADTELSRKYQIALNKK
jgi:hypothetical protein